MNPFRSLCLWLVIAGTASASAEQPKPTVDPKLGWEAALYELTLPSDSASVHYYGRQGSAPEWQRSFAPQPGDTKLGYTYFKYADLNVWHEDRPGGSGWFRLAEEGKTRVWYDTKRDKQRQPEEIVAVPYKLWFAQRTMVYPLPLSDARTLEELPGADGASPLAVRYVEKNLLGGHRTQPEAIPGLGDRAWLFADGSGTGDWKDLIVVRGPAIVLFQGQPLALARTGSQFADNPVLRNVRGGTLAGDLRKYQIGPDSDGGYLDMVALAERADGLLREELLALARDFVREWDRYCAVKVGPGPYFKGHYLDTGSLLPAAADIPGTKEMQRRPDLWSSFLLLGNAAKDNVETLQLDLRVFAPQSNAPTAGQAMDDAAAEFAEALVQQAKSPDLKPLLLQVEGVDQSAAFQTTQDRDGRRLYTTRVLHFRFGNVYGRAMHYRFDFQMENEKIRPLPGDPLVNLVLATLAKMKQAGGASPAAKTQEPAGPGTLRVTAKPDRLWSDGTSTASLRIEARLADGRPTAGLTLKLEVGSPFVGDVVANELATDKDGVATVEYRAGSRPGSNTITVTGEGGLAAATVLKHGGLETAVRSSSLQHLADGAAPVVVVARLVDPDGRPVATAAIDAAVDESEVPGRGALVRDPQRDESAGSWQAWSYTLPQIDPAEGWKGGRVGLKFVAVPPGGTAALESSLALTLHSGLSFWCTIEKPGFAMGRTGFRSERRHGTLGGRATACVGDATVPLAGAMVTVYAANGAAHAIGRGTSGPDGTFAVPFTVEQMVAGPESACTVVPAALALAPEPQHWLEVVRAKAAALRAKGFASAAAEGFAATYCADLAAADDSPTNPRNAARLVVAVRLMGEALGYLDELDDQHSQAEGWLNESLAAAVDDLAKVIDLSSRVEAAQGAAAEYAATAPELDAARAKARTAWNSLRKKALARFVTTAYGVLRDTYKNASDELETREKLGLDNDAGTVAWKKWAVNKANDYYAEWMFAPADAISNWGEAKLKAELTKFLKNAYRGQYPKFFAAALDHAAVRIARGEATWGDPEKAAATLRDDFASVAETYRRANEAHLDRELSRLDLKLAADTVGKGAAIYLAAKEALKTNPAEAKEKILESIDQVDKAFAAVDTACQTYNGQQWFAVCHKARLAIADVAIDAAR